MQKLTVNTDSEVTVNSIQDATSIKDTKLTVNSNSQLTVNSDEDEEGDEEEEKTVLSFPETLEPDPDE